MTGEQLLAAWNIYGEEKTALAWFEWLGLPALPVDDRVDILFDGSTRTIYTFHGCIDLAERLPEQFKRFVTLWRLGVLSHDR